MTSYTGEKRFKSILKILSAAMCFLMLCGLLGCTSQEKDERVKITIPEAHLTETELADLDGYCEYNGYLKASRNKKDGTVIITMTKFVNDLLLTNIGMTVISSVYELIESEAFPYFLDVVSYEKDFTKMTISVDREAYEADGTRSLLPMSVGQTCLMYGTYTPKENPVSEITVIDGKTGETLYTEAYDNLPVNINE